MTPHQPASSGCSQRREPTSFVAAKVPHEHFMFTLPKRSSFPPHVGTILRQKVVQPPQHQHTQVEQQLQLQAPSAKPVGRQEGQRPSPQYAPISSSSKASSYVHQYGGVNSKGTSYVMLGSPDWMQMMSQPSPCWGTMPPTPTPAATRKDASPTRGELRSMSQPPRAPAAMAQHHQNIAVVANASSAPATIVPDSGRSGPGTAPAYALQGPAAAASPVMPAVVCGTVVQVRSQQLQPRSVPILRMAPRSSQNMNTTKKTLSPTSSARTMMIVPGPPQPSAIDPRSSSTRKRGVWRHPQLVNPFLDVIATPRFFSSSNHVMPSRVGVTAAAPVPSWSSGGSVVMAGTVGSGLALSGVAPPGEAHAAGAAYSPIAADATCVVQAPSTTRSNLEHRDGHDQLHPPDLGSPRSSPNSAHMADDPVRGPNSSTTSLSPLQGQLAPAWTTHGTRVLLGQTPEDDRSFHEDPAQRRNKNRGVTGTTTAPQINMMHRIDEIENRPELGKHRLNKTPRTMNSMGMLATSRRGGKIESCREESRSVSESIGSLSSARRTARLAAAAGAISPRGGNSISLKQHQHQDLHAQAASRSYGSSVATSRAGSQSARERRSPRGIGLAGVAANSSGAANFSAVPRPATAPALQPPPNSRRARLMQDRENYNSLMEASIQEQSIQEQSSCSDSLSTTSAAAGAHHRGSNLRKPKFSSKNHSSSVPSPLTSMANSAGVDPAASSSRVKIGTAIADPHLQHAVQGASSKPNSAGAIGDAATGRTARSGRRLLAEGENAPGHDTNRNSEQRAKDGDRAREIAAIEIELQKLRKKKAERESKKAEGQKKTGIASATTCSGGGEDATSSALITSSDGCRNGNVAQAHLATPKRTGRTQAEKASGSGPSNSAMKRPPGAADDELSCTPLYASPPKGRAPGAGPTSGTQTRVAPGYVGLPDEAPPRPPSAGAATAARNYQGLLNDDHADARVDQNTLQHAEATDQQRTAPSSSSATSGSGTKILEIKRCKWIGSKTRTSASLHGNLQRRSCSRGSSSSAVNTASDSKGTTISSRSEATALSASVGERPALTSNEIFSGDIVSPIVPRQNEFPCEASAASSSTQGQGVALVTSALPPASSDEQNDEEAGNETRDGTGDEKRRRSHSPRKLTSLYPDDDVTGKVGEHMPYVSDTREAARKHVYVGSPRVNHNRKNQLSPDNPFHSGDRTKNVPPQSSTSSSSPARASSTSPRMAPLRPTLLEGQENAQQAQQRASSPKAIARRSEAAAARNPFQGSRKSSPSAAFALPNSAGKDTERGSVPTSPAYYCPPSNWTTNSAAKNTTTGARNSGGPVRMRFDAAALRSQSPSPTPCVVAEDANAEAGHSRTLASTNIINTSNSKEVEWGSCSPVRPFSFSGHDAIQAMVADLMDSERVLGEDDEMDTQKQAPVVLSLSFSSADPCSLSSCRDKKASPGARSVESSSALRGSSSRCRLGGGLQNKWSPATPENSSSSKYLLASSHKKNNSCRALPDDASARPPAPPGAKKYVTSPGRDGTKNRGIASTSTSPGSRQAQELLHKLLYEPPFPVTKSMEDHSAVAANNSVSNAGVPARRSDGNQKVQMQSSNKEQRRKKMNAVSPSPRAVTSISQPRQSNHESSPRRPAVDENYNRAIQIENYSPSSRQQTCAQQSPQERSSPRFDISTLDSVLKQLRERNRLGDTPDKVQKRFETIASSGSCLSMGDGAEVIEVGRRPGAGCGTSGSDVVLPKSPSIAELPKVVKKEIPSSPRTGGAEGSSRAGESSSPVNTRLAPNVVMTTPQQGAIPLLAMAAESVAAERTGVDLEDKGDEASSDASCEDLDAVIRKSEKLLRSLHDVF
ncbi:unnamed protein product [Amoebophrya sp. A25]|nr:unnamed protein product [Amoebophrya sp. A25]|eukprot:GSA25T00005905001.1